MVKKKTLPKSVLIFTYYFPPMGGAGVVRVVKFVKYLAEFSYKSIVLTVRNPHYLVQDESFFQDTPPAVEIVRTRAFLPARFFRRALRYNPNSSMETGNIGKKSSGRRLFELLKKLFYTLVFCPDEQIGWIPFAVYEGSKVVSKRRPSVIFSTAPPNSVHLIALLVKKITGVPWVCDFRDLWDQYPDSYNPFKMKIKVGLDNALERWVLKNADRVIVVSEGMKEHLLSKYPALPSRKISVITNGFDPVDFCSVEPVSKDPQKCLIVHAGTIFTWRDPKQFLEPIQRMLSLEPDLTELIRFVFVGLVHPELKHSIYSTNLGSVISVKPHLPYPKMIAWLKAADYLFLQVGDQPLGKRALLLKLFDYMAAGKPILAVAPEGDLSSLVRKYDLGWVAHPEDSEGIRNMFLEAVRHWQSGRPICSYLPEELENDFSRKALTAKLSTLFDDLLLQK